VRVAQDDVVAQGLAGVVLGLCAPTDLIGGDTAVVVVAADQVEQRGPHIAAVGGGRRSWVSTSTSRPVPVWAQSLRSSASTRSRRLVGALIQP
jgi:hypothetical protein